MLLEKDIERAFCKELSVLAPGTVALKVTPDGSTGWPDRMFLLPDETVFFVEFKRPGGKLRPLQEYRKKHLEDLGFVVFKIDRRNAAAETLAEVRSIRAARISRRGNQVASK